MRYKFRGKNENGNWIFGDLIYCGDTGLSEIRSSNDKHFEEVSIKDYDFLEDFISRVDYIYIEKEELIDEIDNVNETTTIIKYEPNTVIKAPYM